MNRKNSIQNFLGCGLAALAITACTDVWDNHYNVDPTIGSNTTEGLWDLIAADPALTEFADQLKRVGYDTVLSKNRYYTVWAPMNGFLSNATNDGILENDSLMEIEFIQNHIANYSHLGKGSQEKNKVEMLNKKLIDFVGSNDSYTFKGIPLVTVNTPAKNGILHRIGSNGEYATFAPNIWEYLDKNEQITNFRDYIKSFTEYTVNEKESVLGPLVDGEVSYLLKVLDEENIWWQHLGEFANEDSSYTVIIPTNDAWNEMYELTKKYYVMDARTPENVRDSLQEYYALNTICKHLSFSNTIQKDEGRDSLISNYALVLGGQRYPTAASQVVFRYEEKDLLFEDEIESVELSNGSVHIVNKLNYSPFKCWHDTITEEAEFLDIEEIDDEDELKKATYSSVSYTHRDTIKHTSKTTSFFVARPLQRSGAIKATFNINGVLSAKYRIKLVVVPAICEYPELLDIYSKEEIDSIFKPTKFKVQLTYPNAKGKAAKQQLGTYVRNSSNPAAMDTIVLNPAIDESAGKFSTEDYTFTFPSCEAILSSNEVPLTTIQIQANAKSSELDKYDRTLRIDCIILEPVE
ncbi:MAG: fasciclin domain-containing protein [Bacteroidaceae bacterium]|nr:fasciclin domain-containing protein [Bacteroidaceae bacterium]